MLEELLGKELADQVAEKLGDKKLGVINDGSWLPKAKLDEKVEQINSYKQQLFERDEQLAKLQPLASGNEALMNQIKELQDANEATKSEYESKLHETNINNALKMYYNGKVHDVDLLIGMLDKSKIELDENGNIKGGLDDQDAALKESKPFLYVPDKEPVVEDKPSITMSVGDPKPSSSQSDDPFQAKLAKLMGQ